MKHLVLIISNGWVSYRMGNQQGSHPIGDDLPKQVCDYLVKMIRPDSYEIIN